jgi:hypothetical protein
MEGRRFSTEDEVLTGLPSYNQGAVTPMMPPEARKVISGGMIVDADVPKELSLPEKELLALLSNHLNKQGAMHRRTRIKILDFLAAVHMKVEMTRPPGEHNVKSYQDGLTMSLKTKYEYLNTLDTISLYFTPERLITEADAYTESKLIDYFVASIHLESVLRWYDRFGGKTESATRKAASFTRTNLLMRLDAHNLRDKSLAQRIRARLTDADKTYSKDEAAKGMFDLEMMVLEAQSITMKKAKASAVGVAVGITAVVALGLTIPLSGAIIAGMSGGGHHAASTPVHETTAPAHAATAPVHKPLLHGEALIQHDQDVSNEDQFRNVFGDTLDGHSMTQAHADAAIHDAITKYATVHEGSQFSNDVLDKAGHELLAYGADHHYNYTDAHGMEKWMTHTYTHTLDQILTYDSEINDVHNQMHHAGPAEHKALAQKLQGFEDSKAHAEDSLKTQAELLHVLQPGQMLPTSSYASSGIHYTALETFPPDVATTVDNPLTDGLTTKHLPTHTFHKMDLNPKQFPTSTAAPPPVNAPPPVTAPPPTVAPPPVVAPPPTITPAPTGVLPSTASVPRPPYGIL